jgi:hypothetical protein
MRVFKFIISIVFFNLLVFTTFAADELVPLVYHYTNPEVTVVFSESLQVSAIRQQEIADSIAGTSTNTLYSPEQESPNNIICTLFGHDIAPESTVTATHHKVNKYNPRCLMEIYHVTYCKRCDYTVTVLDNDFYIFCCPED